MKNYTPFFLLILPILACFSCSSPEENKTGSISYREFVKKVEAKDERFLDQYKHDHEPDWSDGWKLLSTRIDTFQSSTVIKDKNGDREVSKLDTNCLLEWNNEKAGIIRRETYSHGIKRENFEYVLYKDDSIYANGFASFFNGPRAPFANQQRNMKNKIPCKPCGDYSYANYVSAMQSDRLYNEIANHSSFEFQFLDSTGHQLCSYVSARFGAYNYSFKDHTLRVYLSSDTTIARNGSCSFVEVAENVR